MRLISAEVLKLVRRRGRVVDLDQHRGIALCGDLSDRALHDDDTLVDDRHLVAGLLDLVEQV